MIGYIQETQKFVARHQASSMDEAMMSVLLEVAAQETISRSRQDDESQRAFTEKVRVLKHLRSRGFVDFPDKAILQDHTSSGERYAAVGRVTLTYPGKLEIQKHGVLSFVPEMNQILDETRFAASKADFERAIAALMRDPAQAVASASSCMESIAKAVLDSKAIEYPRDESLGPLVNLAFDALQISPRSQEQLEFKKIYGGLLNSALAIGTVRTKYSSAHGKGNGQTTITFTEARLVVHALTTIGLYLLEIAFDNRGQPRAT